MGFAGAKNRKGDKGDQGLPGKPGRDGVDGQAATIRIGSVKTGLAAKVWNSGDAFDVILNFILPKGDKGDKGDRGLPGNPGMIIGDTGGAFFYTKFSCGKLANLDPDDFNVIDCCVLPRTQTRQLLDFGTLKDICL